MAKPLSLSKECSSFLVQNPHDLINKQELFILNLKNQEIYQDQEQIESKIHFN